MFSLTYCSKCETTERVSTSISRSSYFSTSGSGVMSAVKKASVSMPSTMARATPSTSTLTVPSGSFSSCRMVATVPTVYRSRGLGSSTSAAFCATSRICLSRRMASSSARMDLSRPTNSGMTMWGYTTTSRSGSTGTRVVADSLAGLSVSSVTGSSSGAWLRRHGLQSRIRHGGSGGAPQVAD